MAAADGDPDLAEIRRAAADAVVRGAPRLLFDLAARAHPQSGRFYRVPADAAGLAPGLAGAHGDICVCSALIELAAGPARLGLPDAHGAFLSLVLHDDRGGVLAVAGSRKSDRSGRSLLIAGPGWRGEAGPDERLVLASGERVWALARILGAGEGGRDDALRLQQAIRLSCGGGDLPPADATAQLELGEGFEAAFAAMTPAQVLARLVRLAPASPAAAQGARRGARLNNERRQSLEEGAAEGLRRLRRARTEPQAQTIGWREVGAPPPPPLAALTALGAPPREEVLAFTTFSDAGGRPLSGEHDYALVFDAAAAPPVEAFWSICVTTPDGAPVQAPFARLSVGDWFGLPASAAEPFEVRIRVGEGGALQHRLQPPTGPFGLRLELYWPMGAALAGVWRPPEPVDLGPRAVAAISLAAVRSSAIASRWPRSGAGRDVIHFLTKGAHR